MHQICVHISEAKPNYSQIEKTRPRSKEWGEKEEDITNL